MLAKTDSKPTGPAPAWKGLEPTSHDGPEQQLAYERLLAQPRHLMLGGPIPVCQRHYW